MEQKSNAPQQFIQPLFQDAFQRNLIKDILNPEDIIEFVENTLRGRKLNEEGSWAFEVMSKPLKEEGIFKILRILRSHLNKYQTLANLELGDIIRLGKDVRLNIIEIIHEDWEDFTYVGEVAEEPDLSLCTQIVLMIDHNVFANLTRAKGGGESKLLRTVYRSHEVGSQIERSVETQGQGGNFFSNLFRKKQQPQMQQPGQGQY